MPKVKPKTGKKNKNGKGPFQRRSYTIEQKLYAIKMHKAGNPYKEIKRLWEKKYKMEIKSSSLSSWYNTKNIQKMSEYCGSLESDPVISGETRRNTTQRPRLIIDMEYFLDALVDCFVTKSALKGLALEMYSKLVKTGIYDAKGARLRHLADLTEDTISRLLEDKRGNLPCPLCEHRGEEHISPSTDALLAHLTVTHAGDAGVPEDDGTSQDGGVKKFVASDGWCERYITRKNLHNVANEKASSSKQPDVYKENERFIQQEEEMEVEKSDIEKDALELASNIRKKYIKTKEVATQTKSMEALLAEMIKEMNSSYKPKANKDSRMWHKCRSLCEKSIQLSDEEDPLAHSLGHNKIANSQLNPRLQEDIEKDNIVESDIEQKRDFEDTDTFEDLLLEMDEEDLLLEMDDIVKKSEDKRKNNQVLKSIVNLDIVKREETLDFDDVQDTRLPQIPQDSSLGKKVSLNNSVSGKNQSFGCTKCEYTTLDCDEMVMHITSHSYQVDESHNLVNRENYLEFENNYFNSKENSELTLTKDEAISNKICKETSNSVNATDLKSRPIRIKKSTFKILNSESNKIGKRKSRNKIYQEHDHFNSIENSEANKICKETSNSVNAMDLKSRTIRINNFTFKILNSESNKIGKRKSRNRKYQELDHLNSIENSQVTQNKDEAIAKKNYKETSKSVNATDLKSRPIRIKKSTFKLLNLE